MKPQDGQLLIMVVHFTCCWETFYIFAFGGLVVEIPPLNCFFLAPLPTSTKSRDSIRFASLRRPAPGEASPPPLLLEAESSRCPQGAANGARGLTVLAQAGERRGFCGFRVLGKSTRFTSLALERPGLDKLLFWFGVGEGGEASLEPRAQNPGR